MSRNFRNYRIYSPQERDPDLSSGLLLHLAKGRTGLLWEDLSGYRNHAVWSVSSPVPQWVLGHDQKADAIAVQALNTHVPIVPNNSMFDIGTGDLTISAWFYNNKSAGPVGSEAFLGCFETPSQLGWCFGQTAGVTTFRFYWNAVNIDSVVAFPTFQWSHWTIVRKGDDVTMFMNGIQVNTVAGRAADTFNLGAGQGIAIGKWYGNFNNYYAKGKIEDVRFYNRALSSAEVLRLATTNTTVPRKRYRGFIETVGSADPAAFFFFFGD